MTYAWMYVTMSGTWALVAAWLIFACWSNTRYAMERKLGSNR